ncbi:MAG: ABC transporter permease [Candidatus Lokiarchaeota archaeon]|nr:ABC transporter permease [Candidatus Lokiarchaeota archaeon]
MEQPYLEETKGEQYPTVKKKGGFFRYLKFYLIPGWREPDFEDTEYEIGRIKSKRRLFRRLLKPLSIAGIVMILFIAVLGVYSPWLTPFTIENLTPPDFPFETPYLDPSPEHPLGTTKYGFDILGRLIWGARTALTAAALPVIIGTLGGLAVGTISAYFGGKIDAIIMRFCDFWFAFPSLILVIIIAPLIGNSLYNILILFGLFGIPGSTRWVRALVLQVKQNVYVRAAVTSGAEKFKVMFKHVLPNAISPIIIGFFGAMGGAILGFVGIAFLGLGDEAFADWGTDIQFGRGESAAYNAVFWPGLFIAIAAIGFMLIGDGLRDALDPRLHI